MRGAETNTYTVPQAASSTLIYRVNVTYTDAQGYPFNEILGPFRTDIDDDDDGLIDIYYLEDLDRVRYQLDGTGYKESDTITQRTAGCPLVDGVMTCAGYELRRDLDFATTQSYFNASRNKGEWTVDNFDMRC